MRGGQNQEVDFLALSMTVFILSLELSRSNVELLTFNDNEKIVQNLL